MEMEGRSALMKALVGNQENLNEGLKAAIKAAPVKVMEKTPINMKMEAAVKMGMAKKPASIKIRTEGEGAKKRDRKRKESIEKASADKKANAPTKIRTEGEGAKKRDRKERRDHNKAARKTEGTKLMQAARRKFGKNRAK